MIRQNKLAEKSKRGKGKMINKSIRYRIQTKGAFDSV